MQSATTTGAAERNDSRSLLGLCFLWRDDSPSRSELLTLGKSAARRTRGTPAIAGVGLAAPLPYFYLKMQMSEYQRCI